MEKLTELPPNLPIPVDDGACDLLLGQSLPSLYLSSTHGEDIDLSAIPSYVVIYCYPMIGKPGVPLPDGWDEIPGARGCTPQSCSFKDSYQELTDLGAKVFGLSIQNTEDRMEAKERLHLPFELLSDLNLSFATTLKLPMFTIGEQQFIKRVTLIAKDGIIVKVFYPVFPPNRNAADAIEWLKNKES
jgi:peroxiredoxin